MGGLGCGCIWALSQDGQQAVDPANAIAMGLQPLQQRVMQSPRAWQPPRFMQPMTAQQPVQPVSASKSQTETGLSTSPVTKAESQIEASSGLAKQGNRRDLVNSLAFALTGAAAKERAAVAAEEKKLGIPVA